MEKVNNVRMVVRLQVSKCADQGNGLSEVRDGKVYVTGLDISIMGSCSLFSSVLLSDYLAPAPEKR